MNPDATPVQRPDSGVMITLVHGTFATDAPWTKPESALRREWPATPERPVRFEVPDWGGGNSHQDRLTGAVKLAAHLRAVTKDSTATHLVIAHSHGGNVALGALADEDLKGKVKALICLNTPFLHCGWRDLLPLQIVFIAISPPALLILGAMPFLEFFMLPRYPGEYWRPMLYTAGLVIVAQIPAVLLGVPFMKLSERIQSAIRRYQTRESAKFRSSADPALHILAATVKQDEAYRYLWLLDRVTAATTLAAVAGFFLCLAGVALIVVSGSGGFLTDFNWFPALTRAAIVMSRYGVIAIGAGVVLILISAIVMTATSIVLRRHRFSYGEQIADSLFLRIYAKPYPPDPAKADVRYFTAAPGGLKHSALYGSPEVVHALAEWFDKLPDAERTPPGAASEEVRST